MAEGKLVKLGSLITVAISIPVAAGIAIYSYMQMHTIDLGGECKSTEQCKSPADVCMDIEDKSICTMACTPHCPTGFECVEMDVTLVNQAGSHEMKGMRYCLKAEGPQGKKGRRGGKGRRLKGKRGGKGEKGS